MFERRCTGAGCRTRGVITKQIRHGGSGADAAKLERQQGLARGLLQRRAEVCRIDVHRPRGTSRSGSATTTIAASRGFCLGGRGILRWQFLWYDGGCWHRDTCISGWGHGCRRRHDWYRHVVALRRQWPTAASPSATSPGTSPPPPSTSPQLLLEWWAVIKGRGELGRLTMKYRTLPSVGV